MPTEKTGRLSVEVIFALPERVWSATLSLADGACVADALHASGFAETVPDYPHANLVVGIYGQVCKSSRRLVDGDRIEIYRPLTFDPMESRRRRAAHRMAVSAISKNKTSPR